jgi:hypothetical protein
MFLGAHHLVCGCCFTLRVEYFCAAAGRQGWPARTGRQAMQVPARQLFLFIICLMLIFMFPFIEELLFYHAYCDLAGYMKISARSLAPMVYRACYHGS